MFRYPGFNYSSFSANTENCQCSQFINIKVMEVNVHETHKQCRISVRMKFRTIYDKLQFNNAPDTF